jgi:Mn2+/Fe2+ NRAMP family transporter
MSERIAKQSPLARFIVFNRIWMLFHILGPGLIAANADNDASGIFGYSQAGAAYQYGMIWVLILSTVALGVAQEICARMGAVTGKGFADLIRENYGVKVTVVAMLALLAANFATTVSEFAGILAAVEIWLGPSARFYILPLVAAGVWLLIARGSYKRVESVLLWASSVYLLYIVSAVLSHPNWGEVARQSALPSFKNFHPIKDYVFMVINVVGTTITPWGQFYIQSSVRDKGIRAENYGWTRVDVLFGAFFTNFVAFFIIVACGATLYVTGHHTIADAGEAAKALKPLAGPLAATLFAIGLFNASCFGAIAVPLSTAYAVTEALGWESGVGRRIKEAPLFIGIFTALIAVSALVVMLFPNHLAALIILPNIVGAAMMPVILILMLRLVNKKRLMGKYTNSPVYNTISWITTIVLIALSLVLLVTSLLPGGG